MSVRGSQRGTSGGREPPRGGPSQGALGTCSLPSPPPFYLFDASDRVRVALHQLLAGCALCFCLSCTGDLMENEDPDPDPVRVAPTGLSEDTPPRRASCSAGVQVQQ